MLKLLSKYTLAGATGTLAHYIALILLVEIFQINPVIATFSGATLGALINYLLNYYLVFRSEKRHKAAIIKFFSIALLGILLSTGIVHITVSYKQEWYLGGQITATVLYLVLGFWINKRYTF